MDKVVTNDIEAIIPTAGRAEVLFRSLQSLSEQSLLPVNVHIVDASSDTATEKVCVEASASKKLNIIYYKADIKGAAAQRMQAMKSIKSKYVLFMDDDIIFEKDCIHQLVWALSSNPGTGGVNAMVTNQQYHNPGRITSFMYRLMSGKQMSTYAGKCIGPAWNLLPEDKGESINETEWLNTTCTLYRKDALPTPLFPPIFKGYSLMEDLALSLEVSKKWKLYNNRNAKIFHDSQPGDHKNSVHKISKMEMINRYYIMTQVLGKTKIKDYLKFLIFEMWNIISSLNSSRGRNSGIRVLSGKFSALFTVIFNRKMYETN